MRINKLAIKAAFFVCAFFIWGFSVSWVFNHIAAWLGLIVFFIGLVLFVSFLFNKLEEQEK